MEQWLSKKDRYHTIACFFLDRRQQRQSNSSNNGNQSSAMPSFPQQRFNLSLPLLALLSIAGFCIIVVRVHSLTSYSSTTKSVSLAMSGSSSSSPSDARPLALQWKPLGPSDFPTVVSSDDGCRYAKDDEYLKAVLDSWNQDTSSTSSPQRVETSPLIYLDDNGTPLYGHVVRPAVDNKNTSLRPGILLFHTAAGPQDIFLFQKAAKLASSELGAVVLICDVLSDKEGWAWTPDGDRTRFNKVREELLQEGARLMRSRVKAAITTLAGDADLGVDPDRLASLGWCFGAQPILELAALQHQQDGKTSGKDGDATAFTATAMVSYHGVFRRESGLSVDPSKGKTGTDPPEQREVLICTGKSDPFVSRDDLEFAGATMGSQNFAVRIMDFDGAKHGFTNPAQDFNSNPAFQYNENAATQSWEATMELLKRKLS
jgi:dienelactone hydrolase